MWTSKAYLVYHSEKSVSLVFQIIKIIFEKVLNNLSLNSAFLNKYLPWMSAAAGTAKIK